MELTTFLKVLVEHNKTNKGYQVQLNSGNLDKTANKNTDVEFGDLAIVTESLCHKKKMEQIYIL